MELDDLADLKNKALCWDIAVKDLNASQLESLVKLANQYPHGWHTADLRVRKDAKERAFEADWALNFARAIALSMGR